MADDGAWVLFDCAFVDDTNTNCWMLLNALCECTLRAFGMDNELSIGFNLRCGPIKSRCIVCPIAHSEVVGSKHTLTMIFVRGLAHLSSRLLLFKWFLVVCVRVCVELPVPVVGGNGSLFTFCFVH